MFPEISQLASRTVLCIVLAAAMGSAAGAPRQTERSKQKAVAEATRAGIQQKLATLKKEISKTESQKDDAADTLAESEEAISNANRALRELAGEQTQTNQKVAELGSTRQQLGNTIAAQKAQLAMLLREHYVAGNEDRIKLLLSGDNPNRINRDLQMMAYVSQAQATLLNALRTNLAAVEANQLAAQNAKEELEEIAAEQRDQKATLEQEKARRAALLSSLSARLANQRKEIGSLQRDEQRMSGLVDKLSKLIKEQAEAAAAEQRRLAAVAARNKAEAEARAQARAEALAARAAASAARDKAERERLAQAGKPGAKPSGKPDKPFKPDPIDPVEPPKPIARADPKPDPNAARPADIALAPAAPDGAFASLRGKLRKPVAGTVIARFGAKRGGGPSWKGVFIRAAEGSDIAAIAQGRVVFSSWMRGFGNLIIIDHGGEYLSIYGNNQSLLKRVGDAVKSGDPIASAGNTGGNEESGLYFELRHRGAAFDPAGWVGF